MSEKLPVVWFDRVLAEDLRGLIDGRAEIVEANSDDPLGGIERAEGAIVGASIRYDTKVYERAPYLRVIARAGVGYDNLDLEDASSFGIAACNTPDGPSTSTAEHAIALIYGITKGIKPSGLKLERQEGDYWGPHRALELNGSTLGLIGLGRIGGRVAAIAKASGMSVIAHDPYIDDARFDALGVQRAHSLDEAVASAHVVSVHAPLSDATHHLVDARLIAQMQEGVYLVNTARGGLVDPDALLDGLRSGKIRAAGLDVTEPEPLPGHHPLLGRDDCVITPHIASGTVAGRRRIFSMAIDEVMTGLGGTQPPNMLNPRTWPGRNR